MAAATAGPGNLCLWYKLWGGRQCVLMPVPVLIRYCRGTRNFVGNAMRLAAIPPLQVRPTIDSTWAMACAGDDP